jgi:hypothetical protein
MKTMKSLTRGILITGREMMGEVCGWRRKIF